MLLAARLNLLIPGRQQESQCHQPLSVLTEQHEISKAKQCVRRNGASRNFIILLCLSLENVNRITGEAECQDINQHSSNNKTSITSLAIKCKTETNILISDIPYKDD